MADIYIEYLPSIGNPQFDLAARRIVDLLRYYITDHDGKKVTNGDSHDHSGGDGAQIAYSGLSGIPIFVDRGDPSGFDLAVGDLATGAWTDWDISSIVPAGASAVMLSISLNDNAASSSIKFRENGNSNAYNVAVVSTQVADVDIYDSVIVQLGTGRVIEYYATAGLVTCNILIRGWFL